LNIIDPAWMTSLWHTPDVLSKTNLLSPQSPNLLEHIYLFGTIQL